MRKILLWVALAVTIVMLVVLAAMTLFWISVGGTIFRGEHVGIGTVAQIAVALLSCLGLAYLIRVLFHAARRV